MTALPPAGRTPSKAVRLGDVDFPSLEQLLVDIEPPHVPSGRCTERVAFLITKNHPERLRLTLPALAASTDRLYVLDSSTSSETYDLCSHLNLPRTWYHGPHEQRRLVAEKSCLGKALQSGFITWLSDDCWDIWSKRNYALLYARLCNFARVLLIDDDVVAPVGLIGETLDLAERCKVVGAAVSGMPDVSIVGHIAALHGLTSQRFVSGHYLGVDVPAASGFYFADIYNEDWLFALLNSVSRPVARYGTIFQLYWNPYVGTEARAASEEFGETVIEGVARALLAGGGIGCLDKLEHWSNAVDRRHRTIDGLAASDLVTSIPVCTSIMRSVRTATSTITPARCLEFWRAYQARLPEWRVQLQLAASEGSPHESTP